MTRRERILGATRQERADRLPFIHWWRHMQTGWAERECRNRGMGLAWPGNPYLPDLSALHRKAQNFLETKTVNHSAGCVFVNPALRDYYTAKITALNTIPSTVIRNGYNPDDFRPGKPETTAGMEKFFRIGIMGTIYSQGNAPLPLLNALAVLHREAPELAGKLQLVFIGKWSGEFLKMINGHPHCRQISLINYLPHQQALTYVKNLDALALAVHEIQVLKHQFVGLLHGTVRLLESFPALF